MLFLGAQGKEIQKETGLTPSPMVYSDTRRQRLSFRKTISLQNPFDFSEEKTHRNTMVGKPEVDEDLFQYTEDGERSVRQSFDETGSKIEEK